MWQAFFSPSTCAATSTNPSFEGASAAGSSELKRPSKFPVKNTFIDYPADRPPSLEAFYQERRVRSWPASWEDEHGTISELCDETPATPSDDGQYYAYWVGRPAVGFSVTANVGDVKDVADYPMAMMLNTTPVSMVTEASANALQETSAEKAIYERGFDNSTMLGSPELPTVGSAGHDVGRCKPCAFAQKGCRSGVDCQFCHLCELGEKKKRRKEKLQVRRSLVRLRHAVNEGFGGIGGRYLS
mmetsp:Transcript_82042/g.228669  ORF Transcript_82042/g.228669 Transcript_82042/m.228669 type:complete len:243 (+) Transcript_82042:133-861(+)